jgi:hypothetical protein
VAGVTAALPEKSMYRPQLDVVQLMSDGTAGTSTPATANVQPAHNATPNESIATTRQCGSLEPGLRTASFAMANLSNGQLLP